MRVTCILVLLMACHSDPTPPSCIDIGCFSAITFPPDHWEFCRVQDVLCQLPDQRPVVCRVTEADKPLCICRLNADGTVTPLCRPRP